MRCCATWVSRAKDRLMIVVGLTGSPALTLTVESLLFGVSDADPGTLGFHSAPGGVAAGLLHSGGGGQQKWTQRLQCGASRRFINAEKDASRKPPPASAFHGLPTSRHNLRDALQSASPRTMPGAAMAGPVRAGNSRAAHGFASLYRRPPRLV